MSSTAIITVVKMMENLPDSAQSQIVEHLREYLADLEDEGLWDEQFARSQSQLSAAAQKARQEIQAGKARPMEYDRL
jgi:hypothetical protein